MAKKSPPINSGSMADISFLLLTFFLLTSSIDTDLGIARRLPPPLPPDAEAPDIRERNVMIVMVNFNNDLMVNGQRLDIADLRRTTKEFLTNPFDDPHKSEQNEKDIPLLGMVRTSKGVVSLQNDLSTTYEMYIKVQNELTAAVTEMRDAFSQERFGVKFADIKNVKLQEAIQKAIPVPISEAEPKDYGGNK
ncbi:MAG: biopolymer transporter ExbD [Bacteroidales bacterium]|jgi:biopolymer transport protein ExbD|nr:biopolymer transporter ExbD [Bacteroidales bacterium]